MIFRTELNVNSSNFTIDYSSRIFTIGSCFVTEISDKLSHYKIKNFHNPFGVLFHPISIQRAFKRIVFDKAYKEKELYNHNGLYLSWDHHSSYNSNKKQETLDSINQSLSNAVEFAKGANIFIITLGTSFIYRFIERDYIVSNCHKVPSTLFYKEILSEKEIIKSLRMTVELIKKINPKSNIIFTISPVRHIKDGMIQNNVSKARLISATYQVVDDFSNVDYFPSYEFVLDDLRDYRFYKEDMIHPNHVAVNYIWEKFVEKYFSSQAKELLKKVEKVNMSKNHKVFNKDTVEHQKFIDKLNKDISELKLLGIDI